MTVSSEKARTILYFQSALGETNNRAVSGVRRYAKKANWRLVVLHYAQAAKAGDAAAALDSPKALCDLLTNRNPDGCIVEDSASWSGMAPMMKKMKVPFVLYDAQYPQSMNMGVSQVRCDNAAVVEVVSKELFSFDFNDYAYVPHHVPFAWNMARERLFREAVVRRHARYHIYDGIDRSVYAVSRNLVDWIRNLPSPCGVFACNDQTAVRVLDAVEVAGRTIPDDLVMVSVDDDAVKCENTKVTLTSVRLDVEAGGYAAAEVLGEYLRTKNTPVPERSFGVACLVRRTSSRPLLLPDSRVARALETVRLGISQGITAHDVAKEVQMPLRTLHRRFLQAAGHTLGHEIREARLDLAKRLLLTTESSVATIASLCGYDSDSTLRRIFSHRFGVSPSHWRHMAEKSR